MAFVGFNNATVGNQVIEKLDGSYYGAMQMKVSAALGLREAREPARRTSHRQGARLRCAASAGSRAISAESASLVNREKGILV